MELEYNIEKIIPGAEMTPYERETLCNWIIDIIKPKTNILEVGTGVGGSTYYLSKTLSHINKQKSVYTCDPSRSPDNTFLDEMKNVKFFPTTSNDLIDYIIKKSAKLSYIFFDGPEDPDVALNDIKKLEDYIESGCYFSMHDWEIERRKLDGGISTKSLLIRTYIENSTRWEKIEVLDGINSQNSVGFCLYKFLG
jgi:hypothetical protein